MNSTAISPSMTVQQFDALVEQIFTQRAKIDEMNDAVSLENVKLNELKRTAVAALKELGREEYRSPRGTLSLKAIKQWTLPKTPEAKAEFFSHLKERGEFEQIATINHNVFKAYCNNRLAEAERTGEALGFTLPGVELPQTFEDLNVRKATEKKES